MASIILITPTPPDISAFGVRSLSAFLRQAGHRSRLVFLPGSAGLLKEGGKFVYQYETKLIDQIVDICEHYDFIGISFMTYYLDRAIQITRAVQSKTGIPVIWGGIHATCKPEEALLYADMVCVGEGETALLSLLNGEQNIPGIWTKNGSRIVSNGPSPLIKDLDSLPFCDFSNHNHFVYDPLEKNILPLTDERLRAALPVLPYFSGRYLAAFRLMTDRGCPHRCHYCNVPTIKRLYEKSGVSYFRHRSVSHVIAELETVLHRYPFIEAVQFFDDTFFARPVTWLREFADNYSDRIRLPFYCQASPTTLTQAKLDILLQAGLVYVEMGIQTGSSKIRAIYNREESTRQIVNCARMIHAQLPKLLPPDYHVIIDSPWENQADLFDTVRLLRQIPKPYGLAISRLIFFPETELYRRAVQEGFIHDELMDIVRRPFYSAPEKSYPHLLLYLMTFQHIPDRLYSFLLKPKTIQFFEKKDRRIFYRALYIIGETIRLLNKGIKAVIMGDFNRIHGFLKNMRIKDPVVAGRKA